MLAVGVVLVAGLVLLVGPSSKNEAGTQESTNSEQISNSTNNTPATVTEEIPTVPSGKKIPFAEFINRGGSYTCTVEQYVENIDSKGKTYIHNGMIRGEFTSVMEGTTVDSTMILRDGYTYTWSSMMPTMGFKVAAQPPENVNTDTSTSGTYSFNAEQIGDYNCESWTPDLSQFELPEGVVFTTL